MTSMESPLPPSFREALITPDGQESRAGREHPSRWRKLSGGLAAIAMAAAGSTAAIDSAAEVHTPDGIEHVAYQSMQQKPNIIMIRLDDMSKDELRHMPATKRLIFEKGAAFEKHYTPVGLCCPSRTTCLTGNYPHNTGINSNSPPGGFIGFNGRDEKYRTYPIALQRAGYETVQVGKYLNGYGVRSLGVSQRYVPPGYSHWYVPLRGQFSGTNYDVNIDGKIRRDQTEYLGDAETKYIVGLIKSNKDKQGLFVTYDSHAPHAPAPTSPIEKSNKRLRQWANRLVVPRTPNYSEEDVSDKVTYIRTLPKPSEEQMDAADALSGKRALSLRTLDRHVVSIVRALRRTGQLANTYILFQSDNGFHFFNHRLPPGKNSPYEEDIHIPLGVRGPGIAPGTKITKITNMTDIAGTIADMAGTKLGWDSDGVSLLPLLRKEDQPIDAQRDWQLFTKGYVSKYERNGIEEPGSVQEYIAESRIPQYDGVVSKDFKYIAFEDGRVEMYDLAVDPSELDNLTSRPESELTTDQIHRRDEAMRALKVLIGCKGTDACNITSEELWAEPPPPSPTTLPTNPQPTPTATEPTPTPSPSPSESTLPEPTLPAARTGNERLRRSRRSGIKRAA